MDTQVHREQIHNALKAFARGTLRDNARRLFDVLGYRSERRIDLSPNTAEAFLDQFDPEGKLNAKTALLDHWRSVDLLFQLTGDEINQTMQGRLPFSGGRVDDKIIESYLFFTVDLTNDQYTRTQFADFTREINKLFRMPVMLLFRHGDYLTLAIINRCLHKRDESKDVLEKVTLIKDIRFASPHRAHIEILFDLSFDALLARHAFTNFVALHSAWQKTLDTSVLNKQFYQELANWYFWALDHVTFPKDAPKDRDERDAISLIRMVTRLIFCWFLKEKGLITNDLFDEQKVLPSVAKDVKKWQGFVPAAARVRTLSWESGPSIEEFPEILSQRGFTLPQRELRPDGWRLESPLKLRLLEKLRSAGTPLGEYVNGRFYRGVLTGLNEAFVIDRATRDRLIAEHPSSRRLQNSWVWGKVFGSPDSGNSRSEMKKIVLPIAMTFMTTRLNTG